MMRVITAGLFVFLSTFFAFGVERPQRNFVGQWQRSEMIQPQELIIRVRDNGASKPLIIFTGFRSLYRGGHIPGALFGGPASTTEGLETLKLVVQKIPRNREIVIYCGCCPWEACPNVRPAIDVLHQLGFKQVKALVISSNLEADWAAKGYPLEKSQ
jgi:thiosulfate/3-mercaptopyruvate sulfurtransferase